MAYLTRTERYNEILAIAKNIIIEEGIASITVRRIATIGNFAIGQIHHHFKSISQLKALALTNVTEDLIAKTELFYSNESIIEQIINIVSPLDGELGTVMRKLWNEAVFLAERDIDIKQAYKQSIEEWHQATAKLIEEGKTKGNFIALDPSGLAWKLIALSCGFDSIAVVEEFRFKKEVIRNHIYQLLKNEHLE